LLCRNIHAKKLFSIAIISCGMLLAALHPVRADDDDHGERHDHGHHYGWYKHHQPEVIYEPAPVVVVPPPRVVYAPAPVMVAPPVVYSFPSQLNIILPLR
jgi:hypothetical protein